MTRVADQTAATAAEVSVEGATITRFLRLIRFSHTVFALPFALGALVVAADGLPSPRTLLLVLACMVCARTAAMLFNRVVDWSLDQRNPRTALRHRLVPKSVALAALVSASTAFIIFSAFLNRLTFVLSPVALMIVFFYSLTKRFTSLTHFFLGFSLAIAPVGSWIAETGSIAPAPIVLAGAVLLWVAGFDVIYATQDHDFDRQEGLRSVVVRFGIPRSLKLAQLMHVVAFAGLTGFGIEAELGLPYYSAMPLILLTLAYEHYNARRLDVVGINRVFFQSNAFVSAVFLIAVCVDRLA